MKETRIVLRNVGLIDPVSAKEYADKGGYAGLKKALTEMQPSDVIKTVKDSGLRGRGGAGFSTGTKWGFTKGTESDQKYIVCNADEGEPGTNKDRVILNGDPNSVFEGMAIAGYAVGADKGFIYLRAEYPYVRKTLESALENARKEGFLGKGIFGTSFNFDIEVRSGAGAYVCGEETALIESIEGKRGEPRYKPPFPGIAGVWEKPSVVNNVETLANVGQIIENGAEWFKAIGTKGCSGTKLFTLCGNVANRGVYEFPMGTSLRELIYEVGGGIPNGKKLLMVQTGGSSGGCVTADNLDIPMDIDGCQENNTVLGSGAILVVDDTNCVLDVVKNFMSFFRHESCGKCTPCREGTMRLLQIYDRICSGEGTETDLQLLADLSLTMQVASLCGLGQAAPTAVVTTLRSFRDAYLDHIRFKRCPAGVCAMVPGGEGGSH